MELSSNSNLSNLEIPSKIIIDNFQYSFKSELKNQQYSYRCYHRSFKVLITINKENLLKIMNKGNKENEKIEYNINKKEHSCEESIIYTNSEKFKLIKNN